MFASAVSILLWLESDGCLWAYYQRLSRAWTIWIQIQSVSGDVERFKILQTTNKQRDGCDDCVRSDLKGWRVSSRGGMFDFPESYVSLWWEFYPSHGRMRGARVRSDGLERVKRRSLDSEVYPVNIRIAQRRFLCRSPSCTPPPQSCSQDFRKTRNSRLSAPNWKLSKKTQPVLFIVFFI